MKRDQKLKRLRCLQSEIDAIRHELGINHPGAVLYSSPIRALKDEVVVVEADGMGGATTFMVEGNYPVDYITKFEKRFVSKEKAVQKAEGLAGEKEML